MIGLTVMLASYQHDLADVFYRLSGHYSQLVRMDTDVKGINPILEDIKKLAHLPQGIVVAQQWHMLQIKNLSFEYAKNGESNQIFNNISFTVKRGEKIALIGPSGGGKSTLMNLLCGLYTPNSVDLIIDNVPFNSLEPLKVVTTLIPQDPEIFENTIAFNITLDLTTSIEEVYLATKLSCFYPVLNIMPNGLATDIREKGLNLSVGQKQRLALARGLFAARFSSLILMDEPTSSVDLKTEKEILSNIIGAFPDAAILVSLHRLHLLPKFDAIIMFHNGNIIQGSTAELLNKPGPVRDLWEMFCND
jgi:ABC-type multidrug transport system fused ATPase/permease subunit